MKARDIEQDARAVVRDGLVNLPYADGEENEEGRLVRRTFLGTVFALMPSGKYYTPFAASNVAECPRCKGTGTSAKTGRTCKFCMGYESREAYEDAVWMETAEDEASAHDAWVESGEGDPCDLFLCRIDEDDEEGEDSPDPLPDSPSLEDISPAEYFTEAGRCL